MLLLKLVRSNFAAHKARVALTAAAIALAVSLVVAVTTGYASAEAVAYRYLAQMMGSTDIQVTRRGDPHGTVPESVVGMLRADPVVRNVIGRLETESGLIDKKGKPISTHPAVVIGVARPQDKDVTAMTMEGGAWFDTSDEDSVVLDQVAAQRLEAQVGDLITLPGVQRKLKLKVVGIVHKPTILASQVQTLYVPLRTLQRFFDKAGQVNRIMVDLKSSSQAEMFQERWEPRLAKVDPAIKLKSARDARKDMERNLEGLHLLSYLGGTIAMLSATFIVFSALSMGVTERSRVLAMLRAIGGTRSQLAGMVVIEGVILSLVGAAAGTPMGYLWVRLLAWWRHDFFSAGVVLSWGGIAFGVGVSSVAAIFASLLPAWHATRVDPLEALAPQASAPRRRFPWVSALAGLLLVSVDSGLIYGYGLPRELKYYGHFILGLPCLMLGFFLLSPAYVWVGELAFGRLTAGILGVPGRLLRQQLSGGIWRAAGTASALMVGLAILIVLQVQGHSMLEAWKLPDKFPDIFIWAPNGLTFPQAKVVAEVKGLKRGDFMPIAIATPELGAGALSMLGASLLPDATMFFGVDPEQALRMLELEFRDEQGRRPSGAEQNRLARYATDKLKQGRHLIITDELRQLKGYKLGDKIQLKTTSNGPVDYTICGIVWSPGIDVIVSMFDMGRQFDQRTATSVFGSVEDAQRDFGVDRCYVFAANLDLGVQKESLIESMDAQLRRNPTTLPEEKRGILSAVRKLVGEMGLKAGDVRKIKYDIQQGFHRILLLLSTVALASMAIAALGVTNAIMASIRSRRWQFGILRSIGVTRGQLLRLVLAEALLLGAVGCALGLTAGFLMSVNANGLTKYIVGYVVPMRPPWGMIGIGVGASMLVAVVASLRPAITVARSEPLALLQAGRAAT